MGAFNCIGLNWVGNSYAHNTSILRDEWGFKGYIVSDLGAIRKSKGGNYSLVTSKLTAGGYNFDPNTPDEHGYTDIGWYGLVTLGEGTLTGGNVKFPVRISGNNGFSVAIFTVSSAVPLTGITDANGTEIEYKSGIDNSNNLNSYTISYKDPDVRISDHDLFSLVLKGDEPAKAEDYIISLGYAEALDRIGHSTKLYIGERPVPPQTDNRRPGM